MSAVLNKKEKKEKTNRKRWSYDRKLKNTEVLCFCFTVSCQLDIYSADVVLNLLFKQSEVDAITHLGPEVDHVSLVVSVVRLARMLTV